MSNTQRWNRTKIFVGLALGMVAGWLTWQCSYQATGKKEPWDASSSYYLWSLIGSGVISGLPFRLKKFWLGPLGVYVGQFAYVIVSSFQSPSAGMNFFFPLGMIMMAIFLLPAFLGAAAGSLVNEAICRLRASKEI